MLDAPVHRPLWPVPLMPIAGVSRGFIASEPNGSHRLASALIMPMLRSRFVVQSISDMTASKFHRTTTTRSSDRIGQLSKGWESSLNHAALFLSSRASFATACTSIILIPFKNSGPRKAEKSECLGQDRCTALVSGVENCEYATKAIATVSSYESTRMPPT